MRALLVAGVLAGSLFTVGGTHAADMGMPFQHKVEVYRDKDGQWTVFCLKLEQPFLAEEFEKSNYLTLVPRDENAYLVYPKRTRFEQKHAEFYGRLRGRDRAILQLSYEIVSENPDGSRKIQQRSADIAVGIPTQETGAVETLHRWADQQNRYFAELLKFYPDETFFQYCLLQSRDRYGVQPPPLAAVERRGEPLDADLYTVFTGSLAVQESLQRDRLGGGSRAEDQTVHISALSPPALRSLPFDELLEKKRTKDSIEPAPHEMSRIVPEDQYFLHFNSPRAAGDLLDLSVEWGDSLLRLFRVHAEDQRLEQKYAEQLCLKRGPLTKLFADGIIGELAITGSDPFVVEGTDMSVILRLKRPAVFREQADGWLAEARKKHTDLVEQRFNYRGQEVAARYTRDRMVSSFVVFHGEYAIYSNSHRAVRHIIDALVGQTARLYDAKDYRYVTTILPPSKEANTGYLFASEAFIRRNVGPEMKIGEKRRVECFNNLVMLNNASLFYRLEHGESPGSLAELAKQKFVDMNKVVCPHGGAYTFDAEHDTCACSLHNRLRYLTPNAEVPVLKVSPTEQRQYEAYKQRYQQFWQRVFDPIAARITVGPRVKVEMCVLPMANGSVYQELRQSFDNKPQPLPVAQIAPSAVVSMAGVVGRKQVGEYLRSIPGVTRVLEEDPTLTDLAWVGDRVSLHLCDDANVLEFDPTRLRPLELPLLGHTDVKTQILTAGLIWGTKMPVYVSVDLEDRDKAERLLERLSATIFLDSDRNHKLLPTDYDAYRLPDYRGQRMYVVMFGVYAVKLRAHVAVVGNQLVAATRPEILREVIDAAANKIEEKPREGHALVRINRRAMQKFYDDFQRSESEKARLACHRNTIKVYNLVKLYKKSPADVPELAESKYGVRYFCPEGGHYHFDAEADCVECSVHGNRQHSTQVPRPDRAAPLPKFLDSLDEIVVVLKFQDDALVTTVEIARREAGKK